MKALVNWVHQKPEIMHIEAEAEEDNVASIRVLLKSGFIPTGVMGEEGLCFVWKEQP